MRDTLSRYRLISAVFAIAFLNTPVLLWACDCKSNGVGKIDQSDVVFLGTPSDEQWVYGQPGDDTDNWWVSVFRVQTAWKGVTEPTVIVISPIQDCGTRFMVGEPHLVYAKRDSQGRFVTGQCDGTKPRREIPPHQLAALGPGTHLAALPLTAAQAIQIAREYWRQPGIDGRVLADTHDFTPNGQPSAEDHGDVWVVSAMTTQHQIPPLELHVNKQTGVVSEVPHE